ncbi:hypothetical protein [Sphingobium vermicomposti]|uniref:Uncharacterized protein n=1 Tax=Sphingobium vermicomposti TaxID=529005 RepID=A0A846M1H1_9SPHN|nr:hypothetical protein [Sphingobium vermicomposti]NIJ15782.1 hypothetical protein [Sphingobium vermicomposti]
MAEQNIRLRILSYLIAAAAGSALTVAIVTREQAPSPQPTQAEPKQPPKVEVPKIPVIPVPPPPLDRAALLAAAASAADATASGGAMPPSNAQLVGRSFILRMPFGCAGEMTDGADDAWAGWSFNPKSRALRLRARANSLADTEWVKTLAADMKFDAVEGFWIRRPWTRADQCPAEGGVLKDVAASQGQRLAIAQFYSPEGPRTLRRGDRPYSSTVKLEEGEAPSARGYQLQLEGKISGFADGQPIHCFQHDVSLAPRCLIAVQFERVAFVAPDKPEPIVEWH